MNRTDTAALYAWLSRDADGIEGIIAIPIGGAPYPLVMADKRRARSLRLEAELAAKARGFPAVLVRFVRADTIETTGRTDPTGPAGTAGQINSR